MGARAVAWGCGAAAVIGLLWGAWSTLGDPAPTAAPTAAPALAARAAGPQLPAPRPTPLETAAPLAVGPTPEALEAVQVECGFSAARRCDDRSCGAVARMPDLDGPRGWIDVGLVHPELLLTTLAREAGLSDRLLPCVAATAALGPVRMVDLADGSELWCVGDPALCDAEAQAQWGIPFAGRTRVRQFVPRALAD